MTPIIKRAEGREDTVSVYVIKMLTQLDDSTQCFNGLAKISRHGDVQWRFDSEAPALAHHLHMGTDIFCYTLNPVSEDSLVSLFITRSVDNGDVLREIMLPFRAHALSDTHDPSLIQNKRWAVVNGDERWTYIIAISTGETVFSIKDLDIVFSGMEDRIWDIPRPVMDIQDFTCHEYLYDKEQKQFTSQAAKYTVNFENHTAFDGDHQLLFHIKPLEQGQKRKTSNLVPHTIFVTSLKPQHSGIEEPKMTLRYVPMTLPANSGRKTLEFDLPQRACCEDMRVFVIDGYLLVHHLTSDVLVLLDFRPNW